MSRRVADSGRHRAGPGGRARQGLAPAPAPGSRPERAVVEVNATRCRRRCWRASCHPPLGRPRRVQHDAKRSRAGLFVPWQAWDIASTEIARCRSSCRSRCWSVPQERGPPGRRRRGGAVRAQRGDRDHRRSREPRSTRSGSARICSTGSTSCDPGAPPARARRRHLLLAQFPRAIRPHRSRCRGNLRSRRADAEDTTARQRPRARALHGERG